MKNKLLIFLVGGLILGLLLGFFVIWVKGDLEVTPRSRPPSHGLPLADFEAETLTGEKVRLSDYRGQIVIINFWATWCGPCKEEMPLFEEMSERYEGDLIVLAINVEESPEVVQTFIDEIGVTFPILMDRDGEIKQSYLVHGFPTTFFLDREGVLLSQHIGQLSSITLSKYLASLDIKP